MIRHICTTYIFEVTGIINYLGTPAVQECFDKLGMENGDITDNQLSSTVPWMLAGNDCSKQHSRLNFHGATCNAFVPLIENNQGNYYYFEIIYM